MSNYTKTVNFAAKDSLSTGDANKIVKGTEIDTEFNNIATAVATKYDSTTSTISTTTLSATNFSYTGTLTGGTGVISIGSGQLGKDANGNLLVGTTAATNNASTFTVASAKAALILGSSVSADSTSLLDLIKFGATASSSQVYASFAYNSGSNGNGTITGAGVGAAQFTANSDIRLKENIVDLAPQLANIMALRPVEFDYKLEKAHQIGFIAQEVREIYPDLIGETKDGYLTLGGLSKNDSRLIKAIQELKALVDAQAVRIAALEAK